MNRTRALSFRKASECEHGLHKRCRCRCKGTLHGAKRIDSDAIALAYAELSTNDPHFVNPDKNHKGQRVIPGMARFIESSGGSPIFRVALESGESFLFNREAVRGGHP